MAEGRQPKRYRKKKGQVVVVLERPKATHVPFQGTYGPCLILLKPGCPTLVTEATAQSLIEASVDVRITGDSAGYFPERILSARAA